MESDIVVEELVHYVFVCEVFQTVYSVELLRALEEDHGRDALGFVGFFSVRMILPISALPSVYGDVALQNHSLSLSSIDHSLDLRHGLSAVRAPRVVGCGHFAAEEDCDKLFA